MTRKTILGGTVLVALLVLAAALFAIPAWAGLVSITHTTLEDFNAGSLYHTGLTRFDDGEVQLLVVGLAGEWITDTNTTGLPALARHTAVYTNNHIIVLGGRDINSLPSDQVYYTTIDPYSQDLADWQVTTPLPASAYPNGGVFWHTSVVIHDRVYVLGGRDNSGTTYAAVCFAPINADGSLGAWQTTASLDEGLHLLKAVALNGRIYVIGGQNASMAARNTVYVGEPDPATGQIDTWTPTTSFAYPTFAHMVAVDEDNIYVLGGFDPDPDLAPGYISPYAYFATADPITGQLGNWSELTTMEHNLFGGVGLTYSGVLFTTGGAINNMTSPSDYVGATLIGTGGGIGSWQNTSLVEPGRFYHAAVRSGYGWLYVIDGTDGTHPIQSINRGATSGLGAQYAPDGIFTSSTMDLAVVNKIRQLQWSSTISDTSVMTITMQYRTKNSTTDDWSSWYGPYKSSSTPGTVTTTVTLAGAARFVQYRATLATTDDRMTPSLNAVRLVYETLSYSLHMTKDADPSPGSVLVPGDEILYTLTYSNGLGGITTTNTFIVDEPPQYTSYIAGTIFGPGADDSDPSRLRWNVGFVNPGESGQVGYTVLISPTLMENTIIQNIAAIDSDQGAARDSNVITHSVQVSYDLTIVKGADPAPGSLVKPGSYITYMLNYANVGYRDVSGVVLADVLPAEVTYVPGSIWPAGQGDDSDPNQLTWTIGDLAAGEQASARFQAVVNSNVPAGITITNRASIDSDQTEPELSPAVEHVVRELTSSISLTKSANPPAGSMVESGQSIVYTLTYLNDGEATLSDLELTDVLPAYVTYVPGSIWPSTQGDDSDPGTLTWDVPDLAPGASGTARFSVTVDNVPGDLIIENSFAAASFQIEAAQSNSVQHTTYRDAPDLTITEIKTVPAKPKLGVPFNLIVTIENVGSQNADSGDFWVEVYIKPYPSGLWPTGPSDHYLGLCPDQDCSQYRWQYVEGLTSLNVGASFPLQFTGISLPGCGRFWAYAQVDISFDGDDPNWGQYLEASENNNKNRILVDSNIICLPVMTRNH
jgi:uncharacterized repeat protein (TIGR01451 family)